jgi:hypothetical protein
MMGVFFDDATQVRRARRVTMRSTTGFVLTSARRSDAVGGTPTMDKGKHLSVKTTSFTNLGSTACITKSPSH